MKVFKSLIMVFVSVYLIIGVSSFAWSGQKTPQTQKMLPSPKPQTELAPKLKCPNGWHLKAGQFKENEVTICVPNVPSPIQCPKGTDPFFDGCETGCRPKPL